MKIFVIGYMFSRKTTVGKQLAQKLNYRFIDTDQWLENKLNMSISNYFAQYGEAAFRLREAELLKELKDMDNVVISTGGGLPCFHNNMDIIRESGISIYLQAGVNAVYKRYLNSKVERPLLANLNKEEALERIKSHLDLREPHYSRANITVSAENVDTRRLVLILEPYFN